MGSSFPSGIYAAHVVKSFPDVVWSICVRAMPGPLIWVGPVDLQRVATGTWYRVVEQAGLAAILTTGHNGALRNYAGSSYGGVSSLLNSNGTLLHLVDALDPQPYQPWAAAETRDRGIAWLCKQTSAVIRRGQEFVIWGVGGSGNERNILEYAFGDDGAIVFRIGHTGYNPPLAPFEPRTQDTLWYLHLGASRSAYWLTHVEPSPSTAPLVAQDFRTPILVEDARRWDEQALASLLVESSATNAFGNKAGYEFSPLPNALARHSAPQETWTQNDVYVTRLEPGELSWVGTSARPDSYLIPRLDGQPAANQDLAVWIKTAAHHVPTDEDRSNADIGGGMTGIGLVRWSGFRMEPHNLFNANPLGGPARCGP
jgi:hypothetical protein